MEICAGIFLLIIAINIDEWIGDEGGSRKPNIFMLTLMFFLGNFMCATQDIAVDGWSLTMLQRHNIGHSATCNSVGFAIGSFLGFVLFIILDSKDFCNKWLRRTPQPTGIMSFSHYMYFWAITFLVITTVILFLKKDNSLKVVENENEIDLNVKESYFLFWDILKIKPVQTLCWLLLTGKIGFGAISALTPLKLIEAGISKEHIALFNAPFIPFQIILPFTVGRFLVGSKAFIYFIAIIPCRLVIGTFLAILVYLTPYFRHNGDFTYWYYGMIWIVWGLDQMSFYAMSIAGQAFFSKISDPRYGGTYLTLLNTLNNFGGIWPLSAALFLVDPLTWKRCYPECKSIDEKSCRCETIVDGYYVEMLITVIISFVWLIWVRKIIIKIKKLDDSVWLVQRKIRPYQNGLL